MKKKRLIIAVIVLILCVGGYAGVRKLNLNDTAEEEKIYVYQTEEDAITAFSFVSDGETLSFTKNGDAWSYDGDSSFSANQTSISSMVSELAGVEAEQTVDNPEDLSQYGLEEPSNTITITSGDETAVLLIGNENEAAGGYYAKMEGEDTVYLIGTSLPSRFQCSLDTLEETEAETSAEDTSAAETSSQS